MGEAKAVDNVTIETPTGREFKIPIKFTVKENYVTEEEEAEELSQKEIDIDIDELPEDPFLIRIKGRDRSGNEFVRYSIYNRNSFNTILPAITVDVGEGSDTIVGANRYAQIYFEITNNRDQETFAWFSCKDDKYLLNYLHPMA